MRATLLMVSAVSDWRAWPGLRFSLACPGTAGNPCHVLSNIRATRDGAIITLRKVRVTCSELHWSLDRTRGAGPRVPS